jgi:hypothetical protein
VRGKLLPQEFADLQDLAADWSLSTERERQGKRLASSMQELRSVYDRLVPRAEAILEHMRLLEAGGKPKTIPEESHNLIYLLYSLAEIGQAIEVHGQPEVVNGFEAKRWVAEHESPAWKAFEQRVRPTLV